MIFHDKDAKSVLELLNTDKNGLKTAQVKELQEKFGENKLKHFLRKIKMLKFQFIEKPS